MMNRPIAVKNKPLVVNFSNEERGHRNHDAVDEHEARRHPLGGTGGDFEVVHERRQGGVEQRLIENDDERAGDENRKHQVPVDRSAF
jgi:hypothetical protein